MFNNLGQNSFWVWLAFIFIALVATRFIPAKAQGWVFVTLLAGAFVRVANNPKGWAGFTSDLTGGAIK